MIRALILILAFLTLFPDIAASNSNNEILCSEAFSIRDSAKRQVVLQANTIKEKMASEQSMPFDEFVIRSTIIDSLKELVYEMNKLIDEDCSEA